MLIDKTSEHAVKSEEVDMANFDKVFDDIKDQVGLEPEKELNEFSDQGKRDAEAFPDQSRDKLQKWMQLVADKQIDDDEFLWPVERQKAAAQSVFLLYKSPPVLLNATWGRALVRMRAATPEKISR